MHVHTHTHTYTHSHTHTYTCTPECTQAQKELIGVNDIAINLSLCMSFTKDKSSLFHVWFLFCPVRDLCDIHDNCCAFRAILFVFVASMLMAPWTEKPAKPLISHKRWKKKRKNKLCWRNLSSAFFFLSLSFSSIISVLSLSFLQCSSLDAEANVPSAENPAV